MLFILYIIILYIICTTCYNITILYVILYMNFTLLYYELYNIINKYRDQTKLELICIYPERHLLS